MKDFPDEELKQKAMEVARRSVLTDYSLKDAPRLAPEGPIGPDRFTLN